MFVHDRVQDAVHSTNVHLVLMKRYYDEIQCPNVLELIWWYHWEFRLKLHLKLLWCQKDLWLGVVFDNCLAVWSTDVTLMSKSAVNLTNYFTQNKIERWKLIFELINHSSTSCKPSEVHDEEPNNTHFQVHETACYADRQRD